MNGLYVTENGGTGMIVTVTMNPAMDKTAELDCLVRGGLNRSKRTLYDAGGKGINVSKTIQALGGKSVAAGFLGGRTGQKIADMLKKEEISQDFVWVDGETRTNTKIAEADGRVTELNEPGPWIAEEKTEELIEKLAGYAGEETLFVLSGSVPPGVDGQIYARIIRRVHEKGAAVLLDAGGELFRNAVLECPDMVKPNRCELEEYAGYDSGASEAALKKAAAELQAKGTGTVAVSLGKEGAYFLGKSYEAVCPALPVRVCSTVGAGDAMAAALALAWEKKLDREEMLRLCMAVSAGAVTTPGTRPPEKKLVEELAQKVKITVMPVKTPKDEKDLR
jgi:1-phosphofructokinase